MTEFGLEPVIKPLRKQSETAGLPPGTAVLVGERKVEEVRLTVTSYDQKGFNFIEAKSVEECFPFKGAPGVTWIDMIGLHEVGLVEKLGTHFGLHPLTIEDMLNTAQRPKVEIFDEYIYISLKIHKHEGKGIGIEQVSIVLGRGFVLTFQERAGDDFEPVRERIRTGRSRIREGGADFLAYALMDIVVDDYFSVLEKVSEEIDELEEELLAKPTPATMGKIHKLKRDMLKLRRSVWPLREVEGILERGESPLIMEPTRVYLRDLYDHTVQVMDAVETFRDMVSGMIDIYLSSLSNRLNEVMKVLTIFASIFIPLTFIAGVYGMNFQYMPELTWRWGYFAALGFMAAVGVSLLVLFRARKWL